MPCRAKHFKEPLPDRWRCPDCKAVNTLQHYDYAKYASSSCDEDHLLDTYYCRTCNEKAQDVGEDSRLLTAEQIVRAQKKMLVTLICPCCKGKGKQRVYPDEGTKHDYEQEDES